MCDWWCANPNFSTVGPCVAISKGLEASSAASVSSHDIRPKDWGNSQQVAAMLQALEDSSAETSGKPLGNPLERLFSEGSFTKSSKVSS